jgi:hypothetical protein
LSPAESYMQLDLVLWRGVVCKVGRFHMVHFVGKQFLQRANTVLVLTLVWGGVAACAIAATIYDISHWFLG